MSISPAQALTLPEMITIGPAREQQPASHYGLPSYSHLPRVYMARRDDRRDSWPPVPDSPRPGSLYHATTTIDDLTLALTNYSRVPSPEPPPPLACCCGNESCECTKCWLAFKTKLESRLILSAGAFGNSVNVRVCALMPFV